MMPMRGAGKRARSPKWGSLEHLARVGLTQTPDLGEHQKSDRGRTTTSGSPDFGLRAPFFGSTKLMLAMSVHESGPT